MGFSVGKLVADLHKAYSAFLTADQIFALLARLIGVEGFQFGTGDKEDVVGKDLLDVVIADRHVLLRLAQNSVNVLHHGLEGLDRTVLFGERVAVKGHIVEGGTVRENGGNPALNF